MAGPWRRQCLAGPVPAILGESHVVGGDGVGCTAPATPRKTSAPTPHQAPRWPERLVEPIIEDVVCGLCGKAVARLILVRDDTARVWMCLHCYHATHGDIRQPVDA